MASNKKGNHHESENASQKTSDSTSASGGVATGPTEFLGTAEMGTESHESRANGTEGIAVNAETGELSGAGYSTPETIVAEEIDMPKRIVAKDIVGRAALKCTKRTVPVLNEDGTPKKDAEGSIITTVEVSPPRDLYFVFGTATGTRTGTSQYGDWVSFLGNFEAVRSSDGRVSRSSELILQSPADKLLQDALHDVKKRDPGASVSFGFTVGVRTSQRWVDTNEGNSYEYTIRSQINVTRADPLAHLRNVMKAALPAPTQKQIPHQPV